MKNIPLIMERNNKKKGRSPPAADRQKTFFYYCRPTVSQKKAQKACCWWPHSVEAKHMLITRLMWLILYFVSPDGSTLLARYLAIQAAISIGWCDIFIALSART